MEGDRAVGEHQASGSVALRPWEVELDVRDDGSGCHTSLYWIYAWVLRFE